MPTESNPMPIDQVLIVLYILFVFSLLVVYLPPIAFLIVAFIMMSAIVRNLPYVR